MENTGTSGGWQVSYTSLVPQRHGLLLAVLASDALCWITAAPALHWLSVGLLAIWLLQGAFAAVLLADYFGPDCVHAIRRCWRLVAGDALAMLLCLSSLGMRLFQGDRAVTLIVGAAATLAALTLVLAVARVGRATRFDDAEDESVLVGPGVGTFAIAPALDAKADRRA